MHGCNPIRIGLVLAAITAVSAAHAQVTSEQQSALRANCRSDFMSHCSGVTPGGKDALMCLQKNVAGLSAGCQAAVKATMPAPAAPPAPAAAAAPAPTPPPAPAPSPAAQSPAAPPSVQPQPSAASAPAPAAPKRAARPTPPNGAAPPKQATASPAQPPAEPKPPTAAQQSAMRSACRSDFMSQCAGVQPGGKDALVCLQTHVSSLSAACQSVVRETMPPAPGQPAQVVPATSPAAPAHVEPNPVDAVVMIRACKLDLLRHCRDAEIGDGRKLACLNEHQADLTIRCRTALKVTSPLH